jgi:hypothetical protein
LHTLQAASDLGLRLEYEHLSVLLAEVARCRQARNARTYDDDVEGDLVIPTPRGIWFH